MVAPPPVFKATGRAGFTLVEMSIVLVIIGLIIGGVLVGRDLISAATIRSQVSQIEKYQTAVNTFRGKYGYLPGDIPDPAATQNGFPSRGQFAGEGDGNGVIEGVMSDATGQNLGYIEGAGETVTFWVDLSTANLINASFNKASSTTQLGNLTLTTSTKVSDLLPKAVIGRANYVNVFSQNQKNYFGVSALSGATGMFGYTPGIYLPYGQLFSVPGMTVSEAYNIDNKVDDGVPQS